LCEEIDTEIFELKDKRFEINEKLNEFITKNKKQKPQNVKDCEINRKILSTRKGELLNELKNNRTEMNKKNDRIKAIDNKKPDKLKK
jgi:hypothetical protein